MNHDPAQRGGSKRDFTTRPSCDGQRRRWREPSASRFKRIAITFACLFLTAIGIAALMKFISPWIAAAYAGASLISLIAYGWDKSKAKRGVWRTAEITLHFFDLFGDWPGGLIAQQLYRHKTRKLWFQIIFWLSVAVHIGFWGRMLVDQRAMIFGCPCALKFVPFVVHFNCIVPLSGFKNRT